MLILKIFNYTFKFFTQLKRKISFKDINKEIVSTFDFCKILLTFLFKSPFTSNHISFSSAGFTGFKYVTSSLITPYQEKIQLCIKTNYSSDCE